MNHSPDNIRKNTGSFNRKSALVQSSLKQYLGYRDVPRFKKMIRNLIKIGIALRTLDLNRSTPTEEFFSS